MDGGYDARLARRRQQQDALGNVRLFPTPGPKLYAGVVWWAFGLWVLFMAQAPFTPSPEDEQRYSELMQQAVFSDAARRRSSIYTARSATSTRCMFLVGDGAILTTSWCRLVRRLWMSRRAPKPCGAQALQSDATAVGIWSQYGVDEVRERFWKAYQDGKDCGAWRGGT